MNRGVSPVITSALLVLVSIAIVSIVYPWASSIASNINQSLALDFDTYSQKILSDVDVYLPPAEIKDTNTIVIIHNSGARDLYPFSVSMIKRDQTVIPITEIKIIDVNGIVRTYSTGDALRKGETAIARIPATPDSYYGYTLIVTSGSYIKRVEWA